MGAEFGRIKVTSIRLLVLDSSGRRSSFPSCFLRQASRVREMLDVQFSESIWQQFVHRARGMLQRRSVQDYRIDFEDGFGIRTADEEDQFARASAESLADELKGSRIRCDIGLRVKSLDHDTAERATRTLEIFCSTLFAKWTPSIGQYLILTLPKVRSSLQAEAINRICGILENRHKLQPNFIRLELMIESLGVFAANVIPQMIAATASRLQSFHIGSYDLTAQCGVAAQDLSMRHPACDFAIMGLKAATDETDIWISDGATATLPIPPHREGDKALTMSQEAENAKTVFHAWRRSYMDISSSLRLGVPQGWDLHPHQIAIRYLTLAHYYSVNLESMRARMENFFKHKSQATAVGTAFDDAATVRGLTNFFQRGLAIGAIQEEECAGFRLG